MLAAHLLTSLAALLGATLVFAPVPTAAADAPAPTSVTLEGTLLVARADLASGGDGWSVALDQDGATIALDAATSVDGLTAAAHGAAAIVEVNLPEPVVAELEDHDLAPADVDGSDLPTAAAEILAEAPALTVSAVTVASPEARRKVGRAWRTVRKVPAGRSVVRIKAGRAGTAASYRIVVRSTSQRVGVTTRTLTVRAR